MSEDKQELKGDFVGTNHLHCNNGGMKSIPAEQVTQKRIINFQKMTPEQQKIFQALYDRLDKKKIKK